MHVEVSQACQVSDTGIAPQMKGPCFLGYKGIWHTLKLY